MLNSRLPGRITIGAILAVFLAGCTISEEQRAHYLATLTSHQQQVASQSGAIAAAIETCDDDLCRFLIARELGVTINRPPPAPPEAPVVGTVKALANSPVLGVLARGWVAVELAEQARRSLGDVTRQTVAAANVGASASASTAPTITVGGDYVPGTQTNVGGNLGDTTTSGDTSGDTITSGDTTTSGDTSIAGDTTTTEAGDDIVTGDGNFTDTGPIAQGEGDNANNSGEIDIAGRDNCDSAGDDCFVITPITPFTPTGDPDDPDFSPSPPLGTSETGAGPRFGPTCSTPPC